MIRQGREIDLFNCCNQPLAIKASVYLSFWWEALRGSFRDSHGPGPRWPQRRWDLWWLWSNVTDTYTNTLHCMPLAAGARGIKYWNIECICKICGSRWTATCLQMYTRNTLYPSQTGTWSPRYSVILLCNDSSRL